jgi:hypothetical protein
MSRVAARDSFQDAVASVRREITPDPLFRQAALGLSGLARGNPMIKLTVLILRDLAA